MVCGCTPSLHVRIFVNCVDCLHDHPFRCLSSLTSSNIIILFVEDAAAKCVERVIFIIH